MIILREKSIRGVRRQGVTREPPCASGRAGFKSRGIAGGGCKVSPQQSPVLGREVPLSVQRVSKLAVPGEGCA